MQKESIIAIAEAVKSELDKRDTRLDLLESLSPQKGDKGEPGKDASSLNVAIAMAEQDGFFDSIKGEAGKDADPISLEEITDAIKADSPFVQSLQGESIKGDKGEAGKRGKTGEDGKDAAPIIMEDVADALKADSPFIQSLQGESIKGDKGDAGKDGIGFTTKAWVENEIVRKGEIRLYAFGKMVRAIKDTAAHPSNRGEWERIGTAGLEFKGTKSTKAEYEEGDLVIDGGSAFIFTGGKFKMFVQRPKNGIDGKDGEDGKQGKLGKTGKDAPKVLAAEMVGKSLTFVYSDGEVIEADMSPFMDESKAYIDQKFYFRDQDEVKRGTQIRVFRGTWKTDKSYIAGDVVRHNKATWICHKKVGRSQKLTNFNWRILVERGGTISGGGGGAIPIDDDVTHYHGAAPPPSSLGKDEDIYIQTSTTVPSMTFDALDSAAVALVANNSLYMDDAKELRFKDDGGVTHAINMSPH